MAGERSSSISSSSINSQPAGRGGGKTVLVVEDDDRSRRLVAQVLQTDGYTVVSAENGLAALDMLRLAPDVIRAVVLDIQMPGLDGLGVIREIRGDQELKHLPVLALTALARPEEAVRVIEAGCDAYLSKPVALDEFRDLLASLIATCRETPAA